MSSVEFFVRDVRSTPTGEILVVGVPNGEQAVSLGDRFVLQYEVSRDDILSGTPNANRFNTTAIDLVVGKIDVMRKEVRQVSHGMTAALSLAGTGLEQVKAGYFLRTAEM